MSRGKISLFVVKIIHRFDFYNILVLLECTGKIIYLILKILTAFLHPLKIL